MWTEISQRRSYSSHNQFTTMSQDQDAKIVKLNVGGTRYEVARSLIETHPESMLARLISEQWQEDPSKEVFVERDGGRFKYVLDYLRDGKVLLPAFSVPKEVLEKDFEYFGIHLAQDPIELDTAGKLSLKFFAASMDDLNKRIRESDFLRFARACLKDAFTRVLDGENFPLQILINDQNRKIFFLAEEIFTCICPGGGSWQTVYFNKLEKPIRHRDGHVDNSMVIKMRNAFDTVGLNLLQFSWRSDGTYTVKCMPLEEDF